MGEGVGNGVVGEESLVADVIVGVRKEIGADGGDDNLAAVVVGKRGLNGLAARSTGNTRSRAGKSVEGVGVRFDK